jgi:hypothetical protein
VLCTPSSIHEAINKYYSREQAAAELSAGPVKADAKTPKPEPKHEGEAKATRRTGVDPAERAAWKKKQQMGAFVGFNLGCFGTVTIAMVSGYSLSHVWLSYAAAGCVGAIAAGVTWVVMEMKGP